MILQVWKSQEGFAKVSLRQRIAQCQTVGRYFHWQAQHPSDGEQEAKNKFTALGVHELLKLANRPVS